MNLSAGLGIAVREFPLSTGPADYLLYVDGKATGVIEAKPEGHTLTGVETQSSRYVEGLPADVPNAAGETSISVSGTCTSPVRARYTVSSSSPNRLPFSFTREK